MLEIIRVGARTPPDVARAIQRAAQGSGGSAGDARLIRLAPGASVRAEEWGRSEPRARHLARVAAVRLLIHGDRVVSHRSAAAVHGWPRIGDWPSQVDLAEHGRTRSDRRARSVALHPTISEGAVPLAANGTIVPVSTPPIVAADIARTEPFRNAVVMLDHAVRTGVDPLVVGELVRAAGVPRSARAARALGFVDARSESVGESLMRVVLHELGAPPPVLQHEFRSPAGHRAFVDFWFPEHGVVLEFDGEAKYRDTTLRAGRTAEQVVVEEKYREDWIRAVAEVRTVVRVRCAELFRPVVLAAKLGAAGLPLAP